MPRDVHPGRFYLITRRCVQRQFLLRPDAATNQAILYCLAYAAACCGIDVLLPCAMSNHFHAVIFDRHGTYPEFMQRFYGLLARCQNAVRGRWENVWATEQPCVVRLVEREDVLRKLVYLATNPVKDHLVEKVHHWPGINGWAALRSGRAMRATRPAHFFRDCGAMPDEIELRQVIPPELGPAEDIVRELERRIADATLEAAAERCRSGRRVLGRRGVLRQSWRECPTSHEPRRNLRPRVAAASQWSRIEALLRDRAFQVAYREARTRWIAGHPAAFPPGTYWLRRFAHVPLST